MGSKLLLLRMSNHSCEPGRRAPYSENLRWRMIWQREVLGMKLVDIAKCLNVDTSTVWRVNRLFQCTGSVTKCHYPANRRVKKLFDNVKFLILNLVLDKPQLYLREIKAEVLTVTGLDVSLASLCRFLKNMNFSRQKMQMVAKQREDQLRSAFREDISLYESLP